MDQLNAMKTENTLEASAYKSSASQYYVRICEETEGRKTPPNCDVHHINGNHNDNRPENLVIVSEEMHVWLHRGTSKVNPWMKEINWRELKREFQ